jgi:hypothetical protein
MLYVYCALARRPLSQVGLVRKIWNHVSSSWKCIATKTRQFITETIELPGLSPSVQAVKSVEAT